MAMPDIAQLKEQLSFTDDIGLTDDGLLQRALDAAVDYMNTMLGYDLAVTYETSGKPALPPSIRMAILQLGAHYYEQREATGEARKMPFGVDDVIENYREWAF